MQKTQLATRSQFSLPHGEMLVQEPEWAQTSSFLASSPDDSDGFCSLTVRNSALRCHLRFVLEGAFLKSPVWKEMEI